MKLFIRILLGFAALLAILVVGAAAVVATIDKRSLLAPLTARLEQATGREVTIGVEPRIDLSLTPTLVVEDVRFANAPWGSRTDMLHAARIEAQVALLPLLSRRLDLVRVTLVEPRILLETDRNGKANWTFGGPAAIPAERGADGAHAAGMFALGEFAIERGEVDYRDGRSGAVTPIRIERLYVRGRDPGQPLVAQFKGTVDGVPLHLEGVFGPLAALRAGQSPWPVSVKGEVAGRKADVQAKLKRAPDVVEAQDFALTLGASRLAGTLAWQQRKGARPLLRFELAAETLQPLDLAIAAVAAVSPSKDAKPVRDKRLFPAKPVSFDGLQTLDAQGMVSIDTLLLKDGRKIGPLRAKVALDNAWLVLDDLAITAYGATSRGRLAVDARATPATIALRLDGRQLDTAALLSDAGLRRAVHGAKTDVTLDLAMRGNSPRAWAASASGTVTLKTGAGSMPVSNEGLTANVRAALDALNPMRRRGDRVELVCAVARLPFRGGVARVDRSIAIETRELGVSASGSIDLANETLDLLLAPRLRAGTPLDLARLAGAVRLRGPLTGPGVVIDPLGAAVAAADVRALLRGSAAGLLVPGSGGGHECEVALGTRAPSGPATSAPEGKGPGVPVEVEQALRKLFGR